jgi:hypothetical protein
MSPQGRPDGEYRSAEREGDPATPRAGSTIAELHDRAQRVRYSLWTLVVPPSIWAAHFLFCYVFAAIHCAKAGRLASLGPIRVEIGAATVVALGAVGICAFVAWAQSRISGHPPPHRESTEEDRARFLGVAGLLLAGLSAVAIVFTALPAALIGDCR